MKGMKMPRFTLHKWSWVIKCYVHTLIKCHVVLGLQARGKYNAPYSVLNELKGMKMPRFTNELGNKMLGTYFTYSMPRCSWATSPR